MQLRHDLLVDGESSNSEVISVETQLRLIWAGRVRGGGTLGAKEGAVEPTGMYSRRVPAPRTRPVTSQLSFDAIHL